uniref:Uncharacterized protein n=1 Tax=Arundo donax TaxID=35708 RepID=A0A0A8Z765_ARUDO
MEAAVLILQILHVNLLAYLRLTWTFCWAHLQGFLLTYVLVSRKLTVSLVPELLMYPISMPFPVYFWTLLQEFLLIFLLALLKLIASSPPLLLLDQKLLLLPPSLRGSRSLVSLQMFPGLLEWKCHLYLLHYLQ